MGRGLGVGVGRGVGVGVAVGVGVGETVGDGVGDAHGTNRATSSTYIPVSPKASWSTLGLASWCSSAAYPGAAPPVSMPASLR